MSQESSRPWLERPDGALNGVVWSGTERKDIAQEATEEVWRHAFGRERTKEPGWKTQVQKAIVAEISKTDMDEAAEQCQPKS